MTRKRINKGTQEIKAMMAEDGGFFTSRCAHRDPRVLGGGDGRGRRSREGRASGGAIKLSKRLLPAQLDHPDRQARIENSPGPQRTVLHRNIERYQRSEKALVAALTEMYVQGVSTRKVKAISEELCGHSFSASAISGFNRKLDEALGRFAGRELDSEYPYLIVDARYEKVRENAVICSRAVLVAIGIDWEGRRQVLGVEMANRESSTSWKDFLLGLKSVDCGA